MHSRTLLFVHDHVFRKGKHGLYYSEGKFSYSDFDRFRSIAGSIIILSRCEEVENISNLEMSSGEAIEFFPVYGRAWGIIFFKYIYKNFRLIYSLIRRSDLVVVRVPCFLSIPVFFFAFLLRKPYAVEVVGDAGEALYNAGGQRFLYRLAGGFFKFITKAIVRNAYGAIYVTKNQLQAIYPNSKISAFSSNVAINEPGPRVIHERLKSIKSTWGLKRDFHVGVIGSFNNNYKGIDSLILAASEIRREGYNVFLHILGSGDRSLFSDVINETSSDSWVYFDGRRDKEGVLSWLDGIDIYCQPSRTEGLPRALVEAMSRGCPAVGTRVGGIPELLPPERLVPPNNARALAENILQLLYDQKLAELCAQRNFNTASDYYLDVLSERRAAFWSVVAGEVFYKLRS